jgi:DNA-binding response OmpR family regulator
MYSKIFKDITILFAEDEKRLAKLIESAIESYFDSFIMVSNGEEAIKKYHKIKPDIIITDIMMPKMNGLELAKEIKSIDEDIPIIILSAYSHTDMLLEAIEIGVKKDYGVNNEIIKFILWRDKDVPNDRLRTFIKRLREKTSKRLIENISSQGYRVKTL